MISARNAILDIKLIDLAITIQRQEIHENRRTRLQDSVHYCDSTAFIVVYCPSDGMFTRAIACVESQ